MQHITDLLNALGSGGKKIEGRLLEKSFENATTLIMVVETLSSQLENEKTPRKLRRGAQKLLTKIEEKISARMSAELLRSLIAETLRPGKHVYLVTKLISQASRSLERTIQFARLVHESLWLGPLVSEEQGAISAMIFHTFVWSPDFSWVFNVETGERTTEDWKRWNRMLLKGASDGNREAREFLKEFYLMMRSWNMKVTPVPAVDFSPEHREHNLQVGVNKEKGEIFFPASPEEFAILIGLINDVEHELDLLQNEEIEKSKWIVAHKDELTERMEHYLEELAASQRWGIRDGGIDRVDIGLALLNRMGFTSLAFIREGYVPPNVGVTFYGYLFGQPFRWENSLVDGQLQEVNEYWPTTVKILIYYVVVDCYHRITVGKVALPTGESVERLHAQTRTATEAQERRKVWIVRPFLRRLHPGWEASPDVADEARKYFRALPPGFTFVHEHERGWGEHVSTKPLFRYTEKDLERSLRD